MAMQEIELKLTVTADRAIYWEDGTLYLLDQRLLPQREVYIKCHDAKSTAEAITAMVVRGAPAIGVTAAYGIAMAVKLRMAESAKLWRELLEKDFAVLAASRPTAINLFWAIDKFKKLIAASADSAIAEIVANEAIATHQKDAADNRLIGDFGTSLISSKTSVITHCNAGALATGGYGTALGVIRSAVAANKIEQVYVDETRPWLQGARLTAWELLKDNIPVTLMAEGAAAARMQAGGIDWIIVGSDRIAANGDVANKIGTYSLAVAARYHGIKFMVAAPTSTIDLNSLSGAEIPIETRDESELLACAGVSVAAKGARAWNPVFDVTPATLVDAIVTEKGIILEPNAEKISQHCAS